VPARRAHAHAPLLTLIVAAAVALSRLLAAPPAAAASSSSEELVRQAHAHEAAHEEDVALRRYMDALTVDPTNEGAWLGLGALRLRLGDPREAERVYATALEHVPSLHRALEGHAHALWALGRHAEAEADLDQSACASEAGDGAALRQLAEWLGADGRAPAQLATWRRLLAMAAKAADPAAEREARRMVRALVVLVDSADPAASPVEPDATRRALARIARRGG
jgi:tetratricopeptide (TPR) repeat protein